MKKSLYLPLTTSYLLLAPPAHAQVNISGLSFPGMKFPSSGSIADLLTATNLITFVFFLAGIIFFFNLLYAAWDFLLSTGDPKKIAGATSRIINALMGIVIVLASFVIVRLVLAVIGLQGII